MYSMKKENLWEFKYGVPTAGGYESIKTLIVRSKEKIADLKQQCQELGYRIVSCKKLYPFSTNKNQHNFDLIQSICYCRMHELMNGEPEAYKGEFEKLEWAYRKAQEFFCLPLPVAWITWEDYKDAKELANMAILHRQDACIKNGRPDLVAHCAD